MSVTENFDDWYSKLRAKDKAQLLQHILRSHLRPINEGIHAGPAGFIFDGIHAGPSGNSSSMDTNPNSDKKCQYCGK